jgi:two-component system, NarL family, sensor histidine kinase UhpB
MAQRKTSAGTVRDDTRRPMTSGFHPFTGLSTAHPGFPVAAGPQQGLSPFAFVNDAIVQAAREAIITISEDQRIVMINPAAQRMFGLTASEVLGTDLGRLIPQRYRHRHPMLVRAFDHSGTAERPMGERSEVIGLRADGTEFPIEATISRLDVIDGMGPRRFFTALIRDLSEIRDLRGEIEALNRRLRTIFEASPAAIWIVCDGKIVFANHACVGLFGAASERDLLGISALSLFTSAHQESVKAVVSQALAQGRSGPALSTHASIRRLDGSHREVEVATASLPDHGLTTVQMVIADHTRRNREHRALERSRHQLRQLSASLADTREEERRRIARELHDELGQRLTALQMELSSLSAVGSLETMHGRIGSMLDMVNETIASVRRISTDLRPLMLDDLGLGSAIEWLATSWAKRMGISVSLDLGPQDLKLNDSAAIALYRMVQEALTNIARHAGATKVRIQLQRAGGELSLMVQDDGIGFDAQAMQREGSHGLMGIRERAYMLGGELDIGNSTRGGGRIMIRVPMNRVQAIGPSEGDGVRDNAPHSLESAEGPELP